MSTPATPPHVCFVQILSAATMQQPQPQIYLIPLGDIVHMSPEDEAKIKQQKLKPLELHALSRGKKNQATLSAAQQQLPQLCPLFDADQGQSMLATCPACFKCKYIHAILDRAVIPQPNGSHAAHVNYIYHSESMDCPYERYPAHKSFHVALPNATRATDEIPSHLVLKTRALQSNRRVMSHCAHFYFNRICNRGTSCYFIHAMSMTPDATDAARKTHGRMTHAAADGSPLPNLFNNTTSSSVSVCSDTHQHHHHHHQQQQRQHEEDQCVLCLDAGMYEDDDDISCVSDSKYSVAALPPPPYASAAASATCNCSFCVAAAAAAVCSGTPTAACANGANATRGSHVCPQQQREMMTMMMAEQDGEEEEEEQEDSASQPAEEDEEEHFYYSSCVTKHGHFLGSEDNLVEGVSPVSSSGSFAGKASAAKQQQSSLAAYHQSQVYIQPLQPVANDSFSFSKNNTTSSNTVSARYFDLPQPKRCSCSLCLSAVGVASNNWNSNDAFAQQEEQLFCDDYVAPFSPAPNAQKMKAATQQQQQQRSANDANEEDEEEELVANNSNKTRKAPLRWRNEPYSLDKVHVVVSQRKRLAAPLPMRSRKL